VPHFCKPGKTTGRVVGIPDAGMRIPWARFELLALPAHFMHSEGNFQFWDAATAASCSRATWACRWAWTRAVHGQRPGPHLPRMEAFHRRYMVSNKILRLWARDGAAAAHPHDRAAARLPDGGAAVQEFIDWDLGQSRVSEANDTPSGEGFWARQWLMAASMSVMWMLGMGRRAYPQTQAVAPGRKKASKSSRRTLASNSPMLIRARTKGGSNSR
jgi:hypothetical protein